MKRVHAATAPGFIATAQDDDMHVCGPFIGSWCSTASAVAQEAASRDWQERGTKHVKTHVATEIILQMQLSVQPFISLLKRKHKLGRTSAIKPFTSARFPLPSQSQCPPSQARFGPGVSFHAAISWDLRRVLNVPPGEDIHFTEAHQTVNVLTRWRTFFWLLSFSGEASPRYHCHICMWLISKTNMCDVGVSSALCLLSLSFYLSLSIPPSLSLCRCPDGVQMGILAQCGLVSCWWTLLCVKKGPSSFWSAGSLSYKNSGPRTLIKTHYCLCTQTRKSRPSSSPWRFLKTLIFFLFQKYTNRTNIVQNKAKLK